MAKVVRLKAPAQEAPQSKEEVAAQIRELGDLQRMLAREQADMNDAIAAIAQHYQPALETLTRAIEERQAGIQTWCEAHRAELTRDGKTKTANLVTGEVQWRQRPPSVTVRMADFVIETLRNLGLARFVRVKEEVNKEAILAEPEAVAGVAGITIKTGVEDFVITPFEQSVDAA